MTIHASKGLEFELVFAFSLFIGLLLQRDGKSKKRQMQKR